MNNNNNTNEMNMTMEISIINNSNLVEGKSNNGGGYSFVEVYKEVGFDRFVRFYETSAEFSFDPYSGSFGEYNSADSWDWVFETEFDHNIVQEAMEDAVKNNYQVVLDLLYEDGSIVRKELTEEDIMAVSGRTEY